MPHVRPRRITRRGLLAAGGALTVGAFTAACADSEESPGDGSEEGDGTWSFTDDRDERITAPQRPERVVAYSGAAAALHDFGVTEQLAGVFGPTTQDDGAADPLAGDLDVDSLEVLGNAWGEFNIEQYAALEPQLLVTTMWEEDELWFVPEESRSEILGFAPAAGIRVAHVSLREPLERFEELAEALGADLTAPRVADARTRFEDAATALEQAADAAGGITVMAASASADMFYVSDPAVYPDLAFYRELGVEFVVPEETDGYFENLSWENADKYGADVILLDSRSRALQPDDLTDKPIWSTLPAVAAGQIVPWLSEIRPSYAGAAPQLEALAEALGSAEQVR